jgi:hypothetical protein
MEGGTEGLIHTSCQGEERTEARGLLTSCQRCKGMKRQWVESGIMKIRASMFSVATNKAAVKLGAPPVSPNVKPPASTLGFEQAACTAQSNPAGSRVSPWRNSRSRPRASAAPKFLAPDLPHNGAWLRMRRVVKGNSVSRTISTVASVDPPSTTIIST